MKKLLVLFAVLSVLVLAGCELNTNYPTEVRASNYLNPKCVVKVEGCEYFKVSAYGSYNYVHKGNCTNPIHYGKLVETLPEADKTTN